MASDGLEKTPPSADTLCGAPSTEAVREETEKAHGIPSDARSVQSVHSVSPSEQSTIGEHQDVEIADDVLQRTITPKSPLVRVARSKRRGLFSRFALVAEVTEPFDYKDSTKWFVTFIVAVAAAAAPVGSAIILRMLVPCAVHTPGPC